jgi:hypothetical protein
MLGQRGVGSERHTNRMMSSAGGAGLVAVTVSSNGTSFCRGTSQTSFRPSRRGLLAHRNSRKQQHDQRLHAAWQEHGLSYGSHAAYSMGSSLQSRPLVILPGAGPVMLRDTSSCNALYGLEDDWFFAGFGNCTEDYITPYGDAEAGMLALLRSRGYDATVVQLERSEWLNVARNLFTLKFWSSELTTHPGYTWYLDKVHEAVQRARDASGCEQVRSIRSGRSVQGQCRGTLRSRTIACYLWQNNRLLPCSDACTGMRLWELLSLQQPCKGALLRDSSGGLKA